ncbi:FAD-dependent monooxygenase [Piscinibacter koreensis]|uniref:FAD-dependent monooxygenase n=1 Tax=Piscinibacter koreensis TaxID=2742824 RepID=A0A7Y6TYD2_9BURK|nr:FAD-dependent monooxygenase [Schlegelella koreensis]NUZ08089.1 FAD-dependent monooxygenase [Schlegelella koreensis]
MTLSSTHDIATQVVIIGAGPGGLALAADLSSRGIRSVLIESRTEPTLHPRATLLGARSMELYRRFGIANQILAAGLPTDQRYEVIYATRLSGHVLAAYSSPSPDEYLKAHEAMTSSLRDAAWSPYFKVQIGQHALEPIVRDLVASQGQCTLMYGWQFDSFEQDDEGVRCEITCVSSGEKRVVRGAYLAGCDGGGSRVRAQLGIRYVGRGAMRRNVSYLFRSPDFLKHAAVGRANLYFMFLPGNFGVFTNIDGGNTWNYQHYVLDPNEDRDAIDAPAEIRRAMGHDFPFEILGVMRWHHHQSVAERYRDGRVFLCGDSAHLFCPTGGVGMNTAIGDAFDLGWKLTASLQGWGGDELLESYEWERRPIGWRNTVAAANNADRIDALMKVTPDSVEDESELGQRTRERLGKQVADFSRVISSMGLHLGYRYVESPVIIHDGSAEPPDDYRVVVQSTWPGCRAPHAWLAPQISTLDWYDGQGFTLVCSGPGIDVAPLQAAAKDAGVPLKVVSVENPSVAALYERPLVLVRPDGHVCWRGAALPSDLSSLWEVATGRRTKPASTRVESAAHAA